MLALAAALLLAAVLAYFFTGDGGAPGSLDVASNNDTGVAEIQPETTVPEVAAPARSAGGPRKLFSGAAGNGTGADPDDTSASSLAAAAPSAGGRFDEAGPWHPPEVYEDDTAIAGRVMDEDGNPIEAVKVELQPRSAAAPDVTAAEMPALDMASDEEGLFAFMHLEPGVYRLQVEPLLDFEGATRVVNTGQHSVALVLRRPKGVTIQGRVFDADGEPLGDVLVAQADRPEQWELSGPSGDFVVEINVGGKRQQVGLVFSLDGYREKRLSVRKEEWEDPTAFLEVSLERKPRSTEVRGLLSDSEGAPVAGERAMLVCPGLVRSYGATSGDDGRFTLAGLPTGETCDLRVNPRGPYAEFRRDGITLPAGGLDLDIPLTDKQVGTVAGYVLDPGGRELPGFALLLKSAGSGDFSRQLASDATGFFLAERVPAGALRFEVPAQPGLSVDGVHLAAGDEQDVDLVFDWGDHHVVGEVFDPSGAPVAAGRVVLQMNYSDGSIRSRSWRVTTTDSQGQFAFSGIGPGPHAVSVRADGRDEVTMDISVAQPVERISIILK
jgi:protocatechuate 3,4-dioxygenase beta subunit